MTPAEFIRSNRADVVGNWKQSALTLRPIDSGTTDLVLADHIEDLIDAIARELDSTTPLEAGAVGIRSISPPGLVLLDAAARIHTTGRMQGGYQLQQIVAEYRALRASMVRMWRNSIDPSAPNSIDMLERLNDAIDQIVQASVSVYATEVERSRELLLGTLGHDLRNPLNAISMRAALLARMGLSKEAQDVLDPIRSASTRMGQLIGDILDITRVRLGSGLDLNRVNANLGTLCAQSMEEVQSANACNLVRVHATGDLRGFWDTTRIYQALTNLLGNAIQHGKPNAPITVNLDGLESTVTCSVQNWGATIAPDMLARIFEPMLRPQTPQPVQPTSTDSIGLGLYIAKEIIGAHGGTIVVTSTQAEGTVFTIRLPRDLPGAGSAHDPEPEGPLPSRTDGALPLV